MGRESEICNASAILEVSAERAVDTMNFDPSNGRSCSIMWSQGDTSLRESGVGNILIKNLDKSIDNKALYDTFSAFGNILSCNIAQAEDGTSTGYGFVLFDTEEAAEDAIAKVNGMLLNNKKVIVTNWMSSMEWLEKLGDQPKKFTNVYIKNFGEDMDEERLKELAEKFGNVLSLKVVTGESGGSIGVGLVSYETPEQAQWAVNELCGKEWNGQKLYATRAQNKAESLMDLKSQFEKEKSEHISCYQGVNLYVKNLDDTIDDGRLREEFSAYGTITSAKVMLDDEGNSKGFGFVCFSSPEEATKSVTEMNGRILLSKPIYVALAQGKEEHQAQFVAQHMQCVAGLRMQQAAGQQVGQVFPQAGAFYMQPLAQAGQRPYFIPQMQKVRPRWQPMQPQQQEVHPSGMQGIPGGGQVPRARGIRQVPTRGVAGQQSQPTGPGGASQPLVQTGQRPFFIPKMQQVRPRWQPMQPQQQEVRPSGMQGIPGGGQVPRARGIRQVPTRGVAGQQPQPTGPGGANQRLGGMGQPPQVRRGPGGMPAQRQPFKFGQNVRNQPEGHCQPLAQTGQRPFFTPKMQQVRPRWQPMQAQQQEVRPSGMQGIPGGGQVPRGRGIRQVPTRGVGGQQPQPAGPGGANQRLGGMGQPPQVRGGPGGMQAQRQPFKFGQNVRNQPQGHPGTVTMQSQDPVQQSIHIPGQEPLNSRELAAASPQEQKQIIGERLYPLIQSTHPDQAGKITSMLLEIDNAELLHMLESREALAAKTQEAVSVLRAQSEEIKK